MGHFKDTGASDFALTSTGDKVENFEIGFYQPPCILAEKFGEERILNHLNRSLSKEQAMELRIGHFIQNEIKTVIYRKI